MRTPDRGRLTVLAAWTVIAILFRNDFGVYVLVGSVAALIAVEPRPWRVPARRLMVYAIAGAALSIPSLLWIQNHRGLLLYLSEVRESSGAEFTTRRLGGWPVVNLAALTDRDSLVALCYYGYWILPAIALIVLIARSRRRASVSAELGVGWGLVTMALVVNQFFLRSNLQARLGDPSTSVVLVAAWTAGAALGFQTSWVRRLIQVTPAVVLVVLCAALIRANDIPSRFSGTGVAQSLEATWHRFETVKQELRSLPPVQWGDRPTTGNMAVARYLNECLMPDDYVLVGMYADDIVAYSRRRFAGGQAYFDGSFFRSESAQRRAVQRLVAQRVPVAITTPDYRDEFVSDYPLVARYFLEHYRQVGSVAGGEGHTDVLVWVEADRPPVTTDSLLGFPCFR